MADIQSRATQPNDSSDAKGAHTTNGTVPAPSPGNNTADDMTTTTASNLTADEFALYDRQIRLWGSQAQERIRSAHVLLFSLRALGTEIAKNLVLAGINSLTIVDREIVTEKDLGAGFFLREDDIGKPRADAAIPRIQELNPRVNVKADNAVSDTKRNDLDFYHPFDCIIACDLDFKTLNEINTAARILKKPFYAAGIHGFYGFIFADLVVHDFVVEREKSNVATTVGVETTTRRVVGVTNRKESDGKNVEIVQKEELYCPLLLANTCVLPSDILDNKRKLKAVPPLLPCLRALFEFQRGGPYKIGHTSQELRAFTSLARTKSNELRLPPETLHAEFLRTFIQDLDAELPPTAAFVGGRLSEDVINVLGKREQPIQNFAFFDGDAMDGRIYCLYSPPPEIAAARRHAGDGAAEMRMDTSAGAFMDTNMPMNMNMPTNMDMPMNMSMPANMNMPMDMNMNMPVNGMGMGNGMAGMVMDNGMGGLVMSDGMGGVIPVHNGYGNMQAGLQMGDVTGGMNAGMPMDADAGEATAQMPISGSPGETVSSVPTNGEALTDVVQANRDGAQEPTSA